MCARIPRQVIHYTGAIDAVLGGANRDWQTQTGVDTRTGSWAWRGDIRCIPMSLTFILVRVQRRFQTHVIRQRQIHSSAGQSVFAQTASLVVRCIQRPGCRIDARHIRSKSAVSSVDCSLPIRRVVIPAPTQFLLHVDRHVLIVNFGSIRRIHECAESCSHPRDEPAWC